MCAAGTQENRSADRLGVRGQIRVVKSIESSPYHFLIVLLLYAGVEWRQRKRLFGLDLGLLAWQGLRLELHVLPLAARDVLILHLDGRLALAEPDGLCVDESEFLQEKYFGLGVDSLNDRDILGSGCDFLGDFVPEEVDDGVYVPVPEHHFLMVALDLVRVPSPDHFGEVAKDFDPLPLGLGVDNVSKVGEIGDVGIVLDKVPPIELVIAVLFLQALEHPPTLNRQSLLALPGPLPACWTLWFLFHLIRKSNNYTSNKELPNLNVPVPLQKDSPSAHLQCLVLNHSLKMWPFPSTVRILF